MVAGDELYEVAAAAMAPPVAGCSSILSDLEYDAGMNYEGDESSPDPTLFYVHTEQPIAPIQGTQIGHRDGERCGSQRCGSAASCGNPRTILSLCAGALPSVEWSRVGAAVQKVHHRSRRKTSR